MVQPGFVQGFRTCSSWLLHVATKRAMLDSEGQLGQSVFLMSKTLYSLRIFSGIQVLELLQEKAHIQGQNCPLARLRFWGSAGCSVKDYS